MIAGDEGHRKRIVGHRPPLQLAIKSWFAWMPGSRATSIPKGKSSKCSGRRQRRASTCSRSFASIICLQNFRRTFWNRQSGFRNKSMQDSSKNAKTGAKNSSARSIPMTRAISMTRSKLRRTRVVGSLACTSPMSQPTWNRGARWIAKRAGAETVFIHFDKHGVVKNARFAHSVIRSAHRLTYKQAYAILKSPAREQLGERLNLAWELASLLRRKRFEHGALDLDFPEVKVWVDGQGHPVRLERVENDESHQLIEEFMLAANEAVAGELK